MKNKLLFFIIIIEIFIISIYKDNIVKYKHTINIYKESNLNKEKIENYVIGVVAAEMPASFSFEALKAQAVASRTFIYNKIINNKVSIDSLSLDKGQAYISVDEMKAKWKDNYNSNYKKISDAVLSTKGEIVIYDNKPINAYYFSMTNGKTEEAKNVFSEKPYLVSVDSSWDKNVNNFNVINNYKLDEIKDKLGINKDDTFIINEIKYNSTNHVDTIIINNNIYKGTDIRKKLNLRSTDFKFNINGNNVSIETNGYGHGVGMSQYGANYLASNGSNYKEILSYYYVNTSIGTF